jgi:hypothetical protein
VPRRAAPRGRARARARWSRPEERPARTSLRGAPLASAAAAPHCVAAAGARVHLSPARRSRPLGRPAPSLPLLALLLTPARAAHAQRDPEMPCVMRAAAADRRARQPAGPRRRSVRGAAPPRRLRRRAAFALRRLRLAAPPSPPPCGAALASSARRPRLRSLAAAFSLFAAPAGALAPLLEGRKDGSAAGNSRRSTNPSVPRRNSVLLLLATARALARRRLRTVCLFAAPAGALALSWKEGKQGREPGSRGRPTPPQRCARAPPPL